MQAEQIAGADRCERGENQHAWQRFVLFHVLRRWCGRQLSWRVRRPSPHAEPVLVCAILRVLQPYSVLFVYPCSWARRDPQDLCRCRAHFPYPYSRARRAGLGIPCRIPSTRHSPVRGCLYLSVSPAANKALQRTPVNVAKKSSCVHACFAWRGSSLHHGAPLSLSVGLHSCITSSRSS